MLLAKRKSVFSLAEAGGARIDALERVRRAAADNDPLSPVIARTRNELAFHWDRETLKQWLQTEPRPRTAVRWLTAMGPQSDDDFSHLLAESALAEMLVAPVSGDDQNESNRAKRIVELVEDAAALAEDVIHVFETAILRFLQISGATLVRDAT